MHVFYRRIAKPHTNLDDPVHTKSLEHSTPLVYYRFPKALTVTPLVQKRLTKSTSKDPLAYYCMKWHFQEPLSYKNALRHIFRRTPVANNALQSDF